MEQINVDSDIVALVENVAKTKPDAVPFSKVWGGGE